MLEMCWEAWDEKTQNNCLNYNEANGDFFGTRITKSGNSLDLMVESWTGIVSGKVDEWEDMVMVWDLMKY